MKSDFRFIGRIKLRFLVAMVSTFGIHSLVASERDDAVEYVATENSVNAQVEAQARQQSEGKRKQILKEATTAIQETQNVIKALEEGDPDKALELLKKVTGELEIILAREPELALAPADVDVEVIDVVTTVDTVKRIRRQALEALEDGRLQDARRLLMDVGSEIVTSVTNIPLATYPGAMKEAAALIDSGEINEAKAMLEAALKTLVVRDVVIPIPIATARSILKEAEELAEKPDRTEKENERLASLLDHTREELKLAEVLGYGRKRDFKEYYSQLEEIERKTEGGRSGTGFFDGIKALFQSDDEEERRGAES